MNNREALFNRKRGLKQYQKLSDEELFKIVDRELEETELKKSFIGFKDQELERALSLYYKYLDENSFENLAEKSSLITLVYLEILKERIQEFIKKEEIEKNGAIPLQMAEKILEIDTQIMEIKEKLSMLKDKNDSTFVKTWEELKKKALTYYNEHAGCTTVKCPHCQKLFNLLMDVSNLTPEKCSFFRGTTLYNEKLMKLYEEKRLTIDEVAEILGVHPKYINFIFENIYLKEKIRNV